MSLRVILLTALSIVLVSSVASAKVRTDQMQVGRYDGGEMPHGMYMDCVLQAFDACSGWIWIVNDVEGAVWGAILNPHDCASACTSGGEVREIYLYSICATSPVSFGGVGISAVDGVGCSTALLYDSGPTTIVNCTSENRWSIFDVPCAPVNGTYFAVTITWGAQIAGVSQPQFALDNSLANLYCKNNPSQYGVYAGCATSSSSCSSWSLPPARTFIYVTDLNGDGTLDDICALYGQPYPIACCYYSWSYFPANLLVGVGLSCTGASGTESSSWGRVKSLFR